MGSASKHLQPSGKAGSDKKYQGMLVASPAKTISPKCVKNIVPSKHLVISGDSIGHVASFLVKVVALEAVRRVSKAKCPFIWNSVQALQILVYPPFSWIQRWAPLKFVVQGIQKLSMPLLFLSVTTTLSEITSKHDDEPSSNEERPETPSEANETTPSSRTRDVADGTEDIGSENWLVLLFRELEKQDITLPARLTEDELCRFYIAANGDFSYLLSSVKKTIRWRETFHILTLQELEKWSHLVFWHGFDTMLRPCLVVCLGLACSSIPPCDRPCFGQAVVSQIDHGVVNLTNEEDPRITVLLDCHGVSPFRFPMQMILKPSTKQKLRLEGDSYKKTLAEFLQIVPAFLGGKCSCSQCEKPRDSSAIQAGEGSKSQPRQINVDDRSRFTDFDYEAEIPSSYSCEHAIRAAIIGLLMVCIFIAFLAGMNEPSAILSNA